MGRKFIGFIKKKKLDLLCLLVLVLISFTATNFFSPRVPKLGADDRFPLAPTARLREYLHIWSHIVRMFGGPIPMRVATIFPSVSLLAFLENLRLPMVVWQQVEYFLLYLVGSLGVFYFVFLLSKNRIIALSAAIFYVTNPLTLNTLNVSREGTYLWMGYPLMMAFFIRGIFRKDTLKSAVLFALSSILALPGVANPPMLAVVIMSNAAFWFYFLLIGKQKKKKEMFLYGFYCALFYFLINFWWILPLAVVFSQAKSDFVGTYDPVVYAREASSYTSLFGLLRLVKRGDMLPLQSGYYGFHYLIIYDLVSFLSPLLVMLAPLLARKNRRLVAFYTLLTLIAVFFAKGSHPPLRFIYEWLLVHCPGFSMFRTPADKFSLFALLGYSFLIGTSFEEIRVRLGEITRRLYPSLILLFLAVPMVFIFRPGQNLPYEFKYGHILVFAFLVLAGAYLMSLFRERGKISKGNRLAFIILVFLVYVWSLDAKMFKSPLPSLGTLKLVVLLAGGVALAFFSKWRFRLEKKSFFTLAIILAIIPYVFTNAINHLNGTIKLSAPGGMIPGYYYQAKEWLKSQPDEFRLLSLPANAVVAAYHWPGGGGFGGYDFVPEFFERPTVDFLAGDVFSEPIRFQVLKHFGGVSFKKIFPRLVLTDRVAKVLRLMNVKYLFIHHDFWWQYYGTDNPQKVAKDIESQKGIEFERSFGALDFYRVVDSLPHIYATTSATLVSGSAASLTTLSQDGYLDNNPALIISGQQDFSQLNSFYRIGGPVLFENSQYSDLALDYLQSKYGLFLSDPKTISPLRINFSGKYELWAQSEKLYDLGVVDIFLKREKDLLPKKTININSYNFDLSSRRWLKLATLEMEAGEYSLMAPEKIIAAKLGKVVFLPKILREKEEQYLREKMEQAKLKPEYYFSPKKIFFSSQQELFRLESILSRKALIPKKGNYQLEADFSKKKNLVPAAQLFSSPKFVFSPEVSFGLFEDWEIKSGTTGFLVKNRAPFEITIDFKGDSSTPEGVIIENTKAKIDLEEFPFIALNYQVQDNQVQNVYLKLFIDTNGDQVGDFDIELRKGPPFQAPNTAIFNALNLAKEQALDKSVYQVVKIQIVAEKIVGVNCSEAKKGSYEVKINNLAWLKTSPLMPKASLIDLPTNNDPGIYRFLPREKKEDYVGYVYQPGNEFGFIPVINPDELPAYEPLYFFQSERGYLLNRPDKMTFVFPNQGEIGTMEKIGVGFELTDYSGRRREIPYKQFPIVDVDKEGFALTAGGGLEIIKTNEALKGISLSQDDILGYKSQIDGLIIIELRLKTDQGQVFRYLTYGVAIYSAKETQEGFSEEQLPQLLLNKEKINLDNFEKNGTDVSTRKKLKLEKGIADLESDYRSSFYQPKFISLKPEGASGETDQPKIRAQKINFSKYAVEIESATPLWIVFSEAYSDQWKAYLQKETIWDKMPLLKHLVMTGFLSKREPVKDHFLVNVYANAWYLNEPGKHRLVLEYEPQKFLEIGWLISGLTAILGLRFLFKNYRKR